MTTVLLVRHGLTALTGKLLLGWTPGVGLDERGRAQAAAVAARLARVPLDAVVSSPLDRCAQTAAAIAAARPEGAPVPTVQADDRLGECRYGDWTGQELATLVKDPLWPVVQAHPSAVTFPGPQGESLRDTQARGVAAVRDWNSRLGGDATWLACSHGDVIRAIVADALGMHLDMYHRINVDPCSLTVIRYTERRPFVLRLNDLGGAVDDLLPAPAEHRARGADDPGQPPAEEAEKAAAASDSMVGGGAGVYHPA
ncbi:MSMEG_4193 family putative phosphomutase [Frankia sp. CNm7]|uniref:MSMEG_4193 family putative phosphomutase n=1 Tax=Frankia nepalensis TaxID=1836974 RepID=A0A937UPM8_9ACTN|nr:MSMEG_4193 family putative phosphomutase [Frankia nepalensis]MBL7499526.1 MSMEG_4193 family putative phosphomutase [Frankia nepalensis]MBL7516208.1 MSMEG_4193 family putative phosphomutase [Frankia nepalensis]MBL7523643.1 MSMEG_4193 family putative phosphomutase [Frankia nepalensis]MBL7625741.1 MSMEG_4193 family putative phosphomutase [Frankia nepalensis]